MTKFILHTQHIETGRKARFSYDNANSELNDEAGQPVPIPTWFPHRHDYSDAKAFPATSKDTPNAKTSAIRKLKIQLGLHCNYECSYCNQRQSLMPSDASATPHDIELFLRGLPDWFDGGEDGHGTGVQIEFWGGEPFVYWRLLKPLAQALREHYPAARFSVITNGSLLDAEKNAWLDRLGFSVAISHDGPGHHARGPDPMADPKQRAAIFDLYQRLVPAGRISLNAVMHRGNSSRAAVNQWMVKHFGPEVLIGEGAFIDPYDASGIAQSIPDQNWAREYAKQGFLELRAGMAKNMSIAHDKVFDFIESIVNRRSASTLGQKCGMDRQDAIAVDLKGNVLTCQNTSASAQAPNGESHRIGHVSDLESVKLKTATHWSKRQECGVCPVLQLCKGSCMFLEGPLWERSCDNAFADNLSFFAAGIELLTGFAPVYIEGPQRLDRQDVFGLIDAQLNQRPAQPMRKVIPIQPI